MKQVLSAIIVSTLVVLFIFSSLSLIEANPFSTHPYYPLISISEEGILYYSSGAVPTESKDLIRQEGNTYFLTEDISGYCIAITCDNIVFDGNNYSINCGGGGLLEYGIAIKYHYNVLVKNVAIVGFNYGVGLLESANCTINAVTVSGCNRGIQFAESGDIQVSNSELCNNNYGVNFDLSSCNRLINNSLLSNQEGIHIFNSQNNKVVGNTIKNSNLAVSFEYTSHSLADVLPINNVFYLNSFINNTQQVCMVEIKSVIETENASFSNDWDFNQQGNYWSDYSNKGPYVINQNNTDNYPFIQQVDMNIILLNPVATLQTASETGSQPSTLTVTVAVGLGIIVSAFVLSLLFFRWRQKKLIPE
ncbi:MAG: NosD domain-containing protein [Candidatus Bathyarchaeia archaeon]